MPVPAKSPSASIPHQSSSVSEHVDSPVIVDEPETGLPEAPYRPPEAVIDPPEDDPPPYTPGIVAEHIGEDDNMEVDSKFTAKEFNAWQSNLELYDQMEIDQLTSQSSMPQLGPGVLPRRWLAIAHEHELVRPYIEALPPPSKKFHSQTHAQAASGQVSSMSPPPQGPIPVFASNNPFAHESPRIATLEDVIQALPGDGSDPEHWYFCSTCWGWLKIKAGHGMPPGLQRMEEWEAFVIEQKVYPDIESFEKAREQRRDEWARLIGIQNSRLVAPQEHHHFHQFNTLLLSSKLARIDKVEVEEHMNVFPHITVGLDPEESWESFNLPHSPSRLFLSDSSDVWISVDEGLVPGQLPVGLVNAFTAEKMSNPNPGLDGVQSVNEAWNLIATLLINPLFKGQRGWVNLNNAKFQSKIGAGLASSHILYHIGFACQEEPDVHDEGLDRGDALHIGIPKTKHVTAAAPFPDTIREACHILGATKYDTAETLETAYDLQIMFDERNTPRYLGALEKISEAPVVGKSSLELKVAMERSLDKYTDDEVLKAYSLIGYTRQHAEDISIPPQGAPDEYILSMHKSAIQASTSSQQRQDLNKALVLIGRERRSEQLKSMGENGQTLVSVQEAYEALSAPRDAVDDGLIMQYEMAVNEYPGKADHYRMCLSVIADAPGEERPGLKQFLQTGSRGKLHATYSISHVSKVTTQNPMYPLEKIFLQDCKTLVVRQLRLLFLQLYKTELPAVRPDEELAYLAITRPEIDRMVEQTQEPSTELSTAIDSAQITSNVLDSIPSVPNLTTLPSPSSTIFASPPESPRQDLTSTPTPLGQNEITEEMVLDADKENIQSPESSSTQSRDASSTSTILGKRGNQDRERDYSRSPGEARIKCKQAEGSGNNGTREKFESKSALKVELGTGSRMDTAQADQVESPSLVTATEIAHLELTTPAGSPSQICKEEAEVLALTQPEDKYGPPSTPPLLPARPQARKQETLSSGLRFGLQQDAAEVLINVLSQLELALEQPGEDGKEASNLIKNLFSCKYRQQTVYESSPSSSDGQPTYDAQTPVESVFTHPIIGVEEEGKDLYDCLAELYLGGSAIEYEGKKGYMMDLMDEFPPMLYIQMRRSQYDPLTGRDRKTNTHISFPQTLCMSRFLTSAPSEKREESVALTREITRVRTRLHSLINHTPLSIPSTYKHASSALKQLASSGLDISELDGVLSPELCDALDREGDEVIKEIEELQQELPKLKERMDEIWKDVHREEEEEDEHVKSYDYELVSVYMHRGKTSGSGHYWTYQAHLPGHSEEFYNYNDEKVTVVPASEVLQDRTGSDANPALLCYARKGWNLIDSLHREILEHGSPEVEELVLV
ncbi:ubiquitin carboxyl-terminal hydrolase 25/28 [Cryptococcus gattii E566]|uniref:ubiquitinyl hydrolase 1 n=1 Tax=Cryptococcus gattii EJB2 TaxID=1296103 RepID=A0ABR5BNS3_9TREE|nr:ubiquitin carboxyl-terminal hydrolase 25/28 [Cryptococcus gattii EJB2]KIY36277.1 ubiquitin carboxyl-terminal hydrolase 25/28 [Cryptococcus gattii E566]